MTTVEELYELWAGDSELRVAARRSLDPRGPDWLFELFASLGPRHGDLVVDVGCRDARHAIRLATEHGVRVVALDPLPLHVELSRRNVAEAGVDVEVAQAPIESLPLEDASVDWIWCRDVLPHVDLARGLAECARVLRPAGRLIAYSTFATELLEPREREHIVEVTALVPESLDADNAERAAADAGLEVVEVHRLQGEWRERMIEDAKWDPAESLLGLSRIRRRRAEFAREFGETALAAWEGGNLWGIYQLIGKLCPTVYVWEKRA